MSVLPSESTIVIGGVSYKLSKFTLPLYQEFLAWAKAQLPDPWDGLAGRVADLSPELAKYVIDKAEARASSRNSLTDPDIEAIANSLGGVKKILSLLFRRHQPGLTEAQIEAVVEAGIAEYDADFFSRSLSGVLGGSSPTPTA